MTQAQAAPPQPLKRWRLKFGDEVFGPFDRRELEELVAEGRLVRSTLLAEEGRGEHWRPAGSIPELDGLFASASLPAKAKPPRIRREGQPDPAILHIVYGLYVAQLPAQVTALIGVIIAYIYREKARGTWQESHYEYLIRTFWWWALLVVIGWVTVPLGGIGFVILLVSIVWILYRAIRGWIRLGQYRAIEDPRGLF